MKRDDKKLKSKTKTKKTTNKRREGQESSVAKKKDKALTGESKVLANRELKKMESRTVTCQQCNSEYIFLFSKEAKMSNTLSVMTCACSYKEHSVN